MSDMIERAAAAIEAQPQTQTCPTVGRDATTYARAALIAALDPDCYEIVETLAEAMWNDDPDPDADNWVMAGDQDAYRHGARMMLRSARSLITATSQGGTRE